MKTFTLRRAEDETGISGVGNVAQGVEFDDGTVAMKWHVHGMPSSVAFYPDIEAVIKIHGHNGKTAVVWE